MKTAAATAAPTVVPRGNIRVATAFTSVRTTAVATTVPKLTAAMAAAEGASSCELLFPGQMNHAPDSFYK